MYVKILSVIFFIMMLFSMLYMIGCSESAVENQISTSQGEGSINNYTPDDEGIESSAPSDTDSLEESMPDEENAGPLVSLE